MFTSNDIQKEAQTNLTMQNNEGQRNTFRAWNIIHMNLLFRAYA